LMRSARVLRGIWLLHPPFLRPIAPAVFLVWLGKRPHHRAAGHGGPVASGRVAPLLALEVAIPPQRATAGGPRNPGPGSAHGSRQPDLGSTTSPRRTPEAGLRGLRADRLALHAQKAGPGRLGAEMDDLSPESPVRHCRDGLLHRTHRPFRGAVRLLRHSPPAPTGASRQRHPAPDGSVDRTAATGGVSLRYRAPALDLRPGCQVQRRGGGDAPGDAHRALPNVFPEPLAEWCRGAVGTVGQARTLGPRRGLPRS